MSVSNIEAYPGYNCTISQLLHAAKMKLGDAVFGGRMAPTTNQVEADALEKDASEVLSLVRSLKNSLAPINKIAPVVLSLVPDYFDEYDVDRHLVTLTHVCRRWRDTFISRPSLWSRLDFTNSDKTLAYLRRSRSSPLEFNMKRPYNQYDLFHLAVPHLPRLKSLAIDESHCLMVFQHFPLHAPLLEKLEISNDHPEDSATDEKLVDVDLSSLRTLILSEATTCFPWRNLANLKVVILTFCPPDFGITRLLDFFESTPLLHTVEFCRSIPILSDAPPERMVPLRRLTKLRIYDGPPHSVLLNHLHIPTGASLRQEFSYSGKESPLLIYLPKSPANLGNLTHITTIKLCFDFPKKYLKMVGPSGELHMNVQWEGSGGISYNIDRRILRSLGAYSLLMTESLSFSGYQHPNSAEAVFQTLALAINLQTLVLAECANISFILALDPAENPHMPLLCPVLEELVLYIKLRDQFHTNSLVSMAKNRESSGAKLPSITIVGLDELAPAREVLQLKEYVTRVEYRIDEESPTPDDLPSWW